MNKLLDRLSLMIQSRAIVSYSFIWHAGRWLCKELQESEWGGDRRKRFHRCVMSCWWQCLPKNDRCLLKINQHQNIANIMSGLLICPKSCQYHVWSDHVSVHVCWCVMAWLPIHTYIWLSGSLWIISKIIVNAGVLYAGPGTCQTIAQKRRTHFLWRKHNKHVDFSKWILILFISLFIRSFLLLICLFSWEVIFLAEIWVLFTRIL